MQHDAGAIPSGAVTAIGGLPHRDAREAARFALEHLEIPAIPALPRRSPAESSIVQAMVGMQGITIGQYGSISVDPGAIDPFAAVTTDLQHDAFNGFRTFLDEAAGHEGWVKWQFVGPITFGLALVRAGVPMSEAFESSVRCVRAHLEHLIAAVDAALPGCRQLVFVEESDLSELMQPGYPLAPDTAIDLVSGALAAIESSAIAGLHVCGLADIPSQVATGPAVLSLPVRPEVLDSAGHLIRYMEGGGRIAWGAVPTSGPIPHSAERPWRQLSELWCEFVKVGADPLLLRQRSLITPECGLASHTPAVAERVFRITTEVSRRVRDQASAGKWVLGA
jgi:hypothetical protein